MKLNIKNKFCSSEEQARSSAVQRGLVLSWNKMIGSAKDRGDSQYGGWVRRMSTDAASPCDPDFQYLILFLGGCKKILKLVNAF